MILFVTSMRTLAIDSCLFRLFMSMQYVYNIRFWHAEELYVEQGLPEANIGHSPD